MKKILIPAAIFLIPMLSMAQAKVEIGLKGGMNLASISTDNDAVDLSNKTGYHFGAYGLIKILGWGIQPEVLYSTKGTEVKAQNVAQDFSRDFVYLDIPILLKKYFIAGLNIYAGPQFGMLLSTSGKDYDGDKLQKSDFENSDISAVVGAGWDAPFGLNVTARYVIGFSDFSDDFEEKNRMFQLSLGYRLVGLGK